MPHKLTKEDFLKSVSSHEMKVINDSNNVKCIEFSRPNNEISHSFTLTEFGQTLVITGDMGTFSFSRNKNMFSFFRDAELSINPSYWDEKLTSISRFGGLREHKHSAIEEVIRNHADYYLESVRGDYSEPTSVREGDLDFEAIKEEFEEEIDDLISESSLDEYRYIGEIEQFSSQTLPNFDLSECLKDIGAGDFTDHYIWCCYAIVWGISKYDESICE